jgi:hypothetical protein
MLFKKIIEFHSEKYMKRVKKYCGQNVELLKVKTSGEYKWCFKEFNICK